MASGDDFQEMRAFLEKIGSDRKIENQTFAVELKSPWNYLQNQGAGGINQNPAVGGAGEKLTLNSGMWTLSDSNR